MRKRSRSGRGRFGRGQLVRIVLAAFLVLFLGWWSVRMSAVDALVRRNPFLAAVFAPQHPQVKFALARAEFALKQGRVGVARREGTVDALSRATLSEDPFLIAGIQAIADGQAARGERLLEESRRRNPRSRLTRLILLDRYLRANRIDEAGVEISALGRLIPAAPGVLAPELARMARDPARSAAVAEMLARAPTIRSAVLAELARGGADPALILKIASRGPNRETGAEWQRLLVERLVASGRVAEAYRLWLSFARLPAGDGSKGIYDERFAGLPGDPPFNWKLQSGPEGVAERVAGPALQVDYYGRVPITLVRQVLMLRPGSYRLLLRVEGSAKGETSRLAWNLTCLGSKAALLSLPMTDIDSTPRSVGGTFTVPTGGCSAQALTLDGSAGDVPSQESIMVSALQLRPGAGK